MGSADGWGATTAFSATLKTAVSPGPSVLSGQRTRSTTSISQLKIPDMSWLAGAFLKPATADTIGTRHTNSLHLISAALFPSFTACASMEKNEDGSSVQLVVATRSSTAFWPLPETRE